MTATNMDLKDLMWTAPRVNLCMRPPDVGGSPRRALASGHLWGRCRQTLANSPLAQPLRMPQAAALRVFSASTARCSSPNPSGLRREMNTSLSIKQPYDRACMEGVAASKSRLSVGECSGQLRPYVRRGRFSQTVRRPDIRESWHATNRPCGSDDQTPMTPVGMALPSARCRNPAQPALDRL